MAIEKKSMISNRPSVKKAKVANQPTESIGENKPLKVQTLKVEPKGSGTGRTH